MLLILLIIPLTFSTISSAVINRYHKKSEHHGLDLITTNNNNNNIQKLLPWNENLHNSNNENALKCIYQLPPIENELIYNYKQPEKRNTETAENIIHEFWDYPNDYYDCVPNCYNMKNSKVPVDKIFDRDKIKILIWAANQLKALYNLNASQYSDINNYKKLNLSGRREGPLYAEEPKFVVIRREEDLDPNIGIDYLDDPFIPPRGRKHSPELQKLMERYELFIPNRGKKDKINDIFKYEDLFFPNRGKKNIPVDHLVNYKNYV